MKQLLTLTTMVLTIFVLAVGSYAQDTDGGDTTENYNDVYGLDGNGGINRNGDDYMDLDGGPLGGLVGIEDGDKFADNEDPVQYIQYDGNGGINRNDYFDADDTGPHGDLFGLEDDDLLVLLPLLF